MSETKKAESIDDVEKQVGVMRVELFRKTEEGKYLESIKDFEKFAARCHEEEAVQMKVCDGSRTVYWYGAKVANILITF